MNQNLPIKEENDLVKFLCQLYFCIYNFENLKACLINFI